MKNLSERIEIDDEEPIKVTDENLEEFNLIKAEISSIERAAKKKNLTYADKMMVMARLAKVKERVAIIEDQTEKAEAKKSSKMKKAFTLIEMLAVIAIVIILSGMSATVFQQQRSSKSVATVANELATRLMEAHADAMSPAANVTKLDSVEVKLDTTLKSLSVKYKLHSGSVQDTDIPDYNYSNVIITAVPATPFYFTANDAIHMGQILTGSNAVFTVSGSGVGYTVTVDSMTGSVNVVKLP